MDHVDDDTVRNTSDNHTLGEIAAARLTRRSVLGGSVAAAAVVSASGIGALLSWVPASAKVGRKHLLGFTGGPEVGRVPVAQQPKTTCESAR